MAAAPQHVVALNGFLALPMPASTPVAILGFSSTDRLALAASLARTERRTPAYTTVLSIEDARCVIADADHPEVMALLQALGRVGDAVLIRLPHSASTPQRMTGAIDPAVVLRSLDAMLARRATPGATVRGPVAPVAPVASITPTSPITPISPIVLATPAAPSATAAAAHPPSPWHQAHDALRLSRESLRKRSTPLRALLVDDSEIALHFLRRHLDRYGVQSDLARDARRALALLAGQSYDVLFLDLDLSDDNPEGGLALCQQVRGMWRGNGAGAPMVVVVSAFHDPVYKVRGTLAGAEDFLGKPLDPAALERVMQRHGLRLAPSVRPAPATTITPSMPV